MSARSFRPSDAERRAPARPIDGDSLLAVGTALIEAAGRDHELGLALARGPGTTAEPGAPGVRDGWHIATRLSSNPAATRPDVHFAGGMSLAALAQEVRQGAVARWVRTLRARYEAGALHLVRTAGTQTPALLRARLAMEFAAGVPGAARPAEAPARVNFAEAGDDAHTVRSRRARH